MRNLFARLADGNRTKQPLTSFRSIRERAQTCRYGGTNHDTLQVKMSKGTVLVLIPRKSRSVKRSFGSWLAI